MNKLALQEIDFYRLRDEVAGYCITQEGKDSFLQREPLTDSKKIEQLKNLSREWTVYLSAGCKNPVTFWEPVEKLIDIIKARGTSLSLEQLKALGQFVLSVKSVKQAVELHSDELNLKLLLEQINLLPELSETEKKIFHVITTDGQIRDLPEIAAILKQIAALNAKIKKIFQQYTSDQKLANVLESSVPVLRNGRQALAVKASLQNRINGIIIEVSQTAQTVYIEPEEVVRCDNELIQKENELIQVIKKILLELTAELQPSIPELKQSIPIMKLMDTTIAAARWGIEHNCCYAVPAVGEPPLLLKARHPLLGQKAVPIDFYFMEGKRVLIITGPNTGGKTVSLKTFALFSMLNQAGIPVPAAEGTRLPVFTDIFADIGDSQSLDMSLSTFSGHMKNIAQAVTKANKSTLVLLDELGSGTDPLEGTAIAMSVLDTLIEKKAFVLVTTHMGILKNYGYTNPGCVNASVEFDTSTLSPSYKLMMGIPGESHAIAIARKSGLPQEIVNHAKDYIATEQADVSSLIKGLNKKHSELDRLQHRARVLENELEQKVDKLKEKELGLRRKENELKKGHQQEMHDFLIHSRRQLENLVREIREGELTREKTVGVKQFISDLESNVERLDQKIEVEEEKIARDSAAFEKEAAAHKKNSSTKKTKKKLSNAEALKYATASIPAIEVQKATIEKPLVFEPGAAVVAGTNSNQGILLEQARKGVWNVQFGSIKMTMKEKDLKLVRSSSSANPAVSVSYDFESASDSLSNHEHPAFELRLLGMRAEEAVHALEHQIDLCALSNFPHFSIIHGKGEGILQQAVRDYLSHCPVVKSFEFAPPEDGGTGKTYVTLES
ncbi:MAG: Smr/MutS family protein [Treponema sp.]|nr:Smr/MutS family protein [Treponema sp.]